MDILADREGLGQLDQKTSTTDTASPFSSSQPVLE